MSETFWKIVFAVGAAQGVFLCGALLLRRARNRAATRVLALIVGVAYTSRVMALKAAQFSGALACIGHRQGDQLRRRARCRCDQYVHLGARQIRSSLKTFLRSPWVRQCAGPRRETA